MTKKDFTGAVTQARDDRAQEAGIGRMYSSLFITLAGPLALGVMALLDFVPDRWMVWAVLGTAPLGGLLGVLNLLRLRRITGVALVVLLLTLGAAAFTLKLTL